jgi:3D-(3,5/4)-trihydroxycyclohexane-1,2-dione acylhydrolase (decyclizing)
LEALSEALSGYEVEIGYREQAARAVEEWDREVERFYASNDEPLPAQSRVIGAVNTVSESSDIVVCAAGAMPGDLHKLWRTRDPKGYQVEYGYSCMGYEIAGGLGAKMAAPEREVYVMVGDGSYLMLNGELVTSIQERYKLTVVLVDNSGFASIGSLSEAVGSDGFGTHYRYGENGSPGFQSEEAAGEPLPVDLAANAESLGAYVIRTRTIPELRDALERAKDVDETVVIYIRTNRETVPDFESQWDVPIAEISEMDTVRAAREGYEAQKEAERRYL